MPRASEDADTHRMEHHTHSPDISAPLAHPHALGLGAKLALGTAALAGSIILAPYLLPVLGIGSEALAEETLTALCSSGEATGLAGQVNAALAQVPLVGESLAAGGWTNAAGVVTTGVGGHLLANTLRRKEGEAHSGIRLSSIVRSMALATSMLIALPSILTGISAGLVYLSAVVGDTALASSTLTVMSDTLGTTGSTKTLTSGMSGLAVTVPHLLTCGAALFPATLPWLLGGHSKAHTVLGEMQMTATTDASLVAGTPNTVKIYLSTRANGAPISTDDLATVHEKKLHLFIVNAALDEYHHLHPEETSTRGVFSAPFTPQGTGQYHLWTEATRHGISASDVRHATLGSELTSQRTARFAFRPNTRSTESGLAFQWSASPPLRQGQESVVSLMITDTAGQPVSRLEPLLGALAHVAGFSADGQHFVHLHPLDPAQDTQMPLRFHITPQHEGSTRFFVQVKYQGREITTRFDQAIHAARSVTTASVQHHAAFAR